MYIVNKFGVMHDIPDGWALPKGARAATPAEVTAWQAQDAAAKAARLAEVQVQRAAAAQLVIVTAAPETPAEPTRKGKRHESESAE